MPSVVEVEQFACIGIDPTAGTGATWDLAALRAEAKAAGRLRLRDGDVLRGRIVVDGLESPAGARILIAAGTTLISMGESQLDGTFVPFVDLTAVTSAADRPPSDGAPIPEPDFAPQPGGAPDVCPNEIVVVGSPGAQLPPISLLFNQNATINNQFMGVCAEPLPMQLPVPEVVSQTGTRSVVVCGGAGGPGIDVFIDCLAGAILTINGEICNGRGARGADAEAFGLAGPECECGGDASAFGGAGGRAGVLQVSADTIRWGLGGFASVNFGGDGGDALAEGGTGGNCPVCGVDAGRGGRAVAVGGAGGLASRVSVLARTRMVPAPAMVLATKVVLGAAPAGGKAVARGGAGGDAAPCFECPESGGDGGDSGTATARGGNGAPGILLSAVSGGVIKAHLGSDGGDGGSASAQTSNDGGLGGAGATCPCTFPGQAGSGGVGGAGGSAVARGGSGGAASGGSAPIIRVPSSGWGGDASVDCSDGGDGGDAGGCVDQVWAGCTLGLPGGGGAPGAGSAVGGLAGAVDDNAAAGQDGDPQPEDASTCDPGYPGEFAPFTCVVQLCCIASGLPGCEDPACTSAVCSRDPFCCAVAWDQICADTANSICSVCGGSTCCTATGQLGCDDPACVEIVCFVLPGCCALGWDIGCAELAGATCAVCGGGGA